MTGSNETKRVPRQSIPEKPVSETGKTLTTSARLAKGDPTVHRTPASYLRRQIEALRAIEMEASKAKQASANPSANKE